MSRSYKKNPFCTIVSMKDANRRKTKRMSNRSLRRKMNQGLLDNELSSITGFKKVADNSYNYDLFSLRAPNDWIARNDELYKKYYVRK